MKIIVSTLALTALCVPVQAFEADSLRIGFPVSAISENGNFKGKPAREASRATRAEEMRRQQDHAAASRQIQGSQRSTTEASKQVITARRSTSAPKAFAEGSQQAGNRTSQQQTGSAKVNQQQNIHRPRTGQSAEAAASRTSSRRASRKSAAGQNIQQGTEDGRAARRAGAGETEAPASKGQSGQLPAVASEAGHPAGCVAATAAAECGSATGASAANDAAAGWRRPSRSRAGPGRHAARQHRQCPACQIGQQQDFAGLPRAAAVLAQRCVARIRAAHRPWRRPHRGQLSLRRRYICRSAASIARASPPTAAISTGARSSSKEAARIGSACSTARAPVLCRRRAPWRLSHRHRRRRASARFRSSPSRTSEVPR